MSGGKKFELHLTFGRTKSSVQEVIAAMVNKKDTLEKPQIYDFMSKKIIFSWKILD